MIEKFSGSGIFPFEKAIILLGSERNTLNQSPLSEHTTCAVVVPVDSGHKGWIRIEYNSHLRDSNFT